MQINAAEFVIDNLNSATNALSIRSHDDQGDVFPEGHHGDSAQPGNPHDRGRLHDLQGLGCRSALCRGDRRAGQWPARDLQRGARGSRRRPGATTSRSRRSPGRRRRCPRGSPAGSDGARRRLGSGHGSRHPARLRSRTHVRIAGDVEAVRAGVALAGRETDPRRHAGPRRRRRAVVDDAQLAPRAGCGAVERCGRRRTPGRAGPGPRKSRSRRSAHAALPHRRRCPPAARPPRNSTACGCSPGPHTAFMHQWLPYEKYTYRCPGGRTSPRCAAFGRRNAWLPGSSAPRYASTSTMRAARRTPSPVRTSTLLSSSGATVERVAVVERRGSGAAQRRVRSHVLLCAARRSRAASSCRATGSGPATARRGAAPHRAARARASARHSGPRRGSFDTSSSSGTPRSTAWRTSRADDRVRLPERRALLDEVLGEVGRRAHRVVGGGGHRACRRTRRSRSGPRARAATARTCRARRTAAPCPPAGHGCTRAADP